MLFNLILLALLNICYVRYILNHRNSIFFAFTCTLLNVFNLVYVDENIV